MQISSISQTADFSTEFYQNQTSTTKRETSFKNVAETDQTKVTNISNNAPEGVLPVEAYALPSWYANYIPDESLLNTKINHEYWALAEELRKDDNYLSDEDKSILQNYLRNDPMHQEMLAKEKFRQKYKDELYEYNTLLNEYFQEALRENGVNEDSQEDYYKMVILDKTRSEAIHQTMLNKMDNNPRFHELMEILGIRTDT